MADEIVKIDQISLEPGNRRIWTLLIEGGEPFQLKTQSPLPKNPILEHNGGHTVWKMTGSQAEMEILKQTIQDCFGVHVEPLTEIQDDDQTAIRIITTGLPGIR